MFLKARQLGITWLVAVYVCWRLMTRPMFTACVIQQNKDYARDFLRRIRFVYKRLPAWLQRPVVSDSRFELTFLSTSGEENVLRVIAGGDAAGRSLTADLTVFDEHARIPEAQSTRDGCEPALEVAKGQCIIRVSASS